jgi:ATP-binding cassette, subfamily A (ABC1), member 3
VDTISYGLPPLSPVSDFRFLVPSAGKSTTLSVLAGLTTQTSGSVRFAGNVERPKGIIGIVPQKNVLFPELTCYQTLRVWKAIKWSDNSDKDEDLIQLLKDCDLGTKIHANANTLSGGQKRKLQLAIGVVGGSKSKCACS